MSSGPRKRPDTQVGRVWAERLDDIVGRMRQAGVVLFHVSVERDNIRGTLLLEMSAKGTSMLITGPALVELASGHLQIDNKLYLPRRVTIPQGTLLAIIHFWTRFIHLTSLPHSSNHSPITKRREEARAFDCLCTFASMRNYMFLRGGNRTHDWATSPQVLALQAPAYPSDILYRLSPHLPSQPRLMTGYGRCNSFNPQKSDNLEGCF